MLPCTIFQWSLSEGGVPRKGVSPAEAHEHVKMEQTDGQQDDRETENYSHMLATQQAYDRLPYLRNVGELIFSVHLHSYKVSHPND